ncbi:hypothetical protein JCM9279_005839 [Rhodotorula babjevae]
MPAEPVAQPCEVCGVKTIQRCSSCVKAGINLFFCSREHQKLVWSAHKPVCGPGKAHPFAVAPLSEDELSRTLRRLDTMELYEEQTMREWIELGHGTRRSAEWLLREITEAKYRKSSLPTKLSLLSDVRAHLEDVVGPPTAVEDCAFMITCIQDALEDSKLVLSHDSTWVSHVLHKVLIVHRLRELAEDGDQDTQPFNHQVERLDDWIRAGAGSDNPRIRRALAGFQGPTEMDPDP